VTASWAKERPVYPDLDACRADPPSEEVRCDCNVTFCGVSGKPQIPGPPRW